MHLWQKIFDRKHGHVAGILAAMAAALLLTGVAPDAVPGTSAELVALFSGCDVFAPLSHSLWRGVGHIADRLPLGSLAYRWNLVSAVFGTGVVVLVFLLTARLTATNRRDTELIAGQARQAAGNFAGVIAGLLLLTCLPFRILSAVAHPMTFEWFLGLLSFWLLIRALDMKSFKGAAVSTALHAVAASQHPTLLFTSPAFFIVLVGGAWKIGWFRPRPIAVFAGCALLFWLPLLLESYLYLGSPGARWSGENTFGGLLLAALRNYYAAMRHETPQVGMILVLLFGVAPFLFATLMPRRCQPGFYMIVIAGLAVTVPMFLLARFTPWPMFGFSPVLIAPYILAAIAAGIFSACLVHIPPRALFVMSRRRRNAWLQPFLVGLCGLIPVALVIATTVLTATSLNVREGAGAARFAQAVVEGLDDGDWLVADPGIEALLRIKATETERAVLILSTARMESDAYLNVLSESLNNNRLSAMARAGMIPLLAEAHRLPEPERPVIAVIGERSTLRWVTPNVQPDGLVYTIGGLIPQDIAGFVAECLTLWRKTGETYVKALQPEDAFFPVLQQLRLSASRTANDTGVWLEEQNRPELAADVYDAAIQLAGNNLSARLNLVELLPPADPRVAELKGEIETISRTLRGRAELANIVLTYGLLHHPDSSRYLASRWYAAGGTAIAMEEMNGDQTASSVESALAEPDDDDAFRGLLSLIDLEDDIAPQDVPAARTAALLAMTRLAAMKERPDLARRLLRLTEATASENELAVEDANISYLSGDRDAAYNTLSSLEAKSVPGPRGLVLLALLTIESNPVEAKRHIDRLEAVPDLSPQVRLALAKIYIATGDIAGAEMHLELLAGTRRLDREVLALYLELLLKEDRLEVAGPTISRMLRIDTRDPLANYAHAQRLTARGLQDEALAAVTLSLNEAPTTAGWLLKAEILTAQEKFAEAANAAEAGLRIQPGHEGLTEAKERALNGLPF